MPSYAPPKKNAEYIFYIGLRSQADSTILQANPTIAAGDFKVSIDGGAFANPATLPAVTPAAGKAVKVTLSAAEMNGDNISFYGSDAAGAEWMDTPLICIQPGFDLANHATPLGSIPVLGIVDSGTLQSATATTAVLRAAASFANSRLVGATILITGGTGVGQSRVITTYVDATDTATVDTWNTTPDSTSTYVVFAGAPASTVSPVPANVTQWLGATAPANTGDAFARLGDPAGASVSADVAAIQADTDNMQTRLPAALVGGRMDSSVGAMAAGVITAAAHAVGAIDAAALAADAGNEIADALLDRNMTTGTDSGSPTVRTVRQALRASRNRVAIAAGVATIYKEDDTTASWTSTITTTAGNPISESNPADA